MKKIFTLIAVLGILSSASMQAQDFPSDPGTLTVTLTLSAVDEATDDSIPGYAPVGSGAYEAGTSLTLTAQTIPGYTFVRWSDEETTMSRQFTVNEPTDLQARYSHDEYTIIFLDANGQELSNKTYFYGEAIEVPDDPEKEGDAQYSYTFSGWSPTVPATATGSQTFTPQFTQSINRYEITFLDRDEETVLRVDTLEFGAMPQFNGTLPNDTIDGTVYTWVGWTPELHQVASDETYVANYSESTLTFTVTVIIGDGQPTEQEVAWGNTIVLEAQDTDDEHFLRWSDGSEESYRQVTITSDSTFIAEFGPSFVDISVAANQWTFFCLPQPMIGDGWSSDMFVTTELAGVKWGTYNGAVRAQAKSGWETPATYNATQGYILYSTQAGRLRLNIYPENLMQDELTVPLVAYEAEFAQNANWNFVGNPYNAIVTPQSYSISGIQDASAFVWDGVGYTNTLVEELTLQPLQAFFIQAEEESELSFAGANNPAPARRTAQVEENSRIDIQATAGDYTDKTRVLFRENSSVKYEAGRDAAKFMTATAPIQMYFLDVDNIECAQMVRPAGEDNIRLGYMLSQAGNIEINMPIYADGYELYDALTDRSYDLFETVSIYSEKGSFNDRLQLRPIRKVTTAIDNSSAAVKTAKLIINGQLFLIRDGKMYSVQGVEVK